MRSCMMHGDVDSTINWFDVRMSGAVANKTQTSNSPAIECIQQTSSDLNQFNPPCTN